VRRPWHPDPGPRIRWRTSGELCGSISAPVARRCANPSVRWHRPGCCVESGRESPSDKDGRCGRTNNRPCRAGCRERSVGRKPCTGIGPSRKSCGGVPDRGSDRHIDEKPRDESNSSTAQKQVGRYSSVHSKAWRIGSITMYCVKFKSLTSLWPCKMLWLKMFPRNDN